MSSVKAKAAYLEGLLDGLKIDKNSDTGKLFYQISQVLKEMSEEIERLEEQNRNIIDYVDQIDDDLCDLEESISYPDEDYDEDYCDDFQTEDDEELE